MILIQLQRCRLLLPRVLLIIIVLLCIRRQQLQQQQAGVVKSFCIITRTHQQLTVRQSNHVNSIQQQHQQRILDQQIHQRYLHRRQYWVNYPRQQLWNSPSIDDDEIKNDSDNIDWSFLSSGNDSRSNSNNTNLSITFQSSMIQYVSQYLDRLNNSDTTTTTTIDSSNSTASTSNIVINDDDDDDVLVTGTETETHNLQFSSENTNKTSALPSNEENVSTIITTTTLTSWTTPSENILSTANDITKQLQQQEGIRSTTSKTLSLMSLQTATSINRTVTLSYMIGIPITNSQLLMEIESIQRAITYHCPILQYSCISTTMSSNPSSSTLSSSSSLRIPLLYLTTTIPSVNATTISVSTMTSIMLQQLLQEAVDTVVDKQQATANDADEYNDDFHVSCAALEIDGGTIHPQNEVLYTTMQSSSTDTNKSAHQMILQIIKRFQYSIQEKYPQQQWNMQSPPWNDYGENNDMYDAFRLRLPIMRLPNDWNTIILAQQQQQQQQRKADDSDSNNNINFLSSDQGGNGISPLFWGKYLDDIFVKDCLLQQISIYPGTMNRNDDAASNNDTTSYHESIQWTESVFPHMAYSVSLMNGVVKETTIAEELIEMEILQQTTADIDNKFNSRSDDDKDLSKRDRMNQIIASQQRMQQSQKVIKEPGTYNPLFEKYRDGTLVPKAEAVSIQASQLPTLPFPNRELAIGFWKIIRSPTGFENEQYGDNDITKSDNLILRVDGSIAGGPILDTLTRQKAAGGSWTYTETIISRSTEDNFTNDTVKSAKLQIRFIIPPKKDRVIVMEGQFQKMSTALDDNKGNTEVNDDTTYVCSGNVWMEDYNNGMDEISSKPLILQQRDNSIGTFTIMKILNTRSTDPSQFSITIPKNVRSID